MKNTIKYDIQRIKNTMLKSEKYISFAEKQNAKEELEELMAKKKAKEELLEYYQELLQKETADGPDTFEHGGTKYRKRVDGAFEGINEKGEIIIYTQQIINLLNHKRIELERGEYYAAFTPNEGRSKWLTRSEGGRIFFGTDEKKKTAFKSLEEITEAVEKAI